jgi:hypothetical protein
VPQNRNRLHSTQRKRLFIIHCYKVLGFNFIITVTKMVSPKHLLSTLESALLGSSPPTPSQRIEVLHAIRSSLQSFQSLLSYPPPNSSDRAQVQSKSIRLQDSTLITLDDNDVQIVSFSVKCLFTFIDSLFVF